LTKEAAMKAAIVYGAGRTPVYGEFAEPEILPGDSRITVAASALSHVTRSRAAGSHYSASARFPFVPGIDGAGRLDDGTRVYFVLPTSPWGGMSERTVAPQANCLPLPDALDDVTAAAIVNPGMSSWVALTERARLKKGETVLVNGATGIAGRLAVQIAKHLGAKKVIASGRSEDALRAVAKLGADATISLTQTEAALEDALRAQFAQGIDVVVDYLWGKSAERLLITAAKAGLEPTPIRVVQVGSMSGADITLPSAVLRSSAIELMGSGIGSVPHQRMLAAMRGLLDAAVPARLEIATCRVPLTEVEQAWTADDNRRRVVFTMAETA
jgi:NADPH:quinone reductase-like Zn-dependent oxidoreductase